MSALVPHPSSSAPRFSKQRRPFLEPIAFPKEYPHFEKPPMTNNVNLTLPLRAVIPDEAARAEAEGRLVFHLSGDTGSIHGDNSQVAIAEAMEQQVKSATDADRPAFLYNLGDVIYFNGQSEFYTSQFYEPYQYYPHPYSPLRAITTAILGQGRETQPTPNPLSTDSWRTSARSRPITSARIGRP